jgi:Putative Ig domain/Galactose oxidase, central domain/Kelch motif
MSVRVRVPRLGLLVLLGTLLSPHLLTGQIVGPNVNMVSGTQWPGGDPFLQRQNEPSIAVSSRNPFHLLAGANDYRSVDLALTTNGETGDAWLGLFKSLDGGATWRSILLPGCPYNTPICAGAPAVRNAGYQAAADPTVRAGTNGMFYYAGLVFNRGFNPHSAIVVSRLIDLNNKENADPNDILNGDAIQYLGTSIVANGSASVFLDKPTMAVDIPRTGAQTCNLGVHQPGNGEVHQSFAGGNVYVAYTGFAEEPNTDPETVTSPQKSKIYFVRSKNCGATWSSPIAISGSGAINQGAVIAIDPLKGTLYVVWRQFHFKSGSGLTDQPDAIVGTISTDGGEHFSAPVRVSTFTPFDEGTTNTSFRTNAYPTAVFDGSGRLYVAYSARNTVPSGDARIVMTTSLGGMSWTTPVPIDNPVIDPLTNPLGRGHQIMPALTFAAGRLSLLYYDLRLDHTFGVFSPLLSQGQPTGLYTEFPELAGELGLTPPLTSLVFNQFIDDSTITLRRHTFDLRIAQARPGKVPAFAPSAVVSQYAYGCCAANQSDIEQMQFNAPNLPLFRSGTAPFMGDYVDLTASPQILPPQQPAPIPDTDVGDVDADDWKFNVNASTPTIFHATWTDNRDVQAPTDGDWTHYTPPNSPSVGSTSIFQPGTTVPACQVGFTGSRNQNIYTAPISGGLIFGAPGNSKQLGTTVFNGQTVPFQRAFAVVAQNATNVVKSYRLTIANQPPGGNASFLQFSQLTLLDLSIPPTSSATRPVFVTSTNPAASVTINIVEITAPQGSVVPNGLASSTTLNPDPTNPAITNPAITNPAITNPAITNFEVTNPAITNPAITNPAITNPAITNPAITNPAITNSTFQNVSVVNPAITNPAITNPAITNASIANPAITNPAITNVNPANASVSDTQWTVSNTGNTEGSFAVKLASSATVPPQNFLQLIISKLYQTPAVATGDCTLKVETHNVVVTNIVDQNVLLNPNDPAITNPAITNPAITNATVALAPGETANIILRVVNEDTQHFPTFNAAASVAPVVVSQAVPTQTVLANGGGPPPPPPITVPPLQITTTSLPDAVTGLVYTATVQTIGGNPTTHTFAISSGALPPGLTLDPVSGAITGQATTIGPATFSFQVQAQDVGSTLFPQHTAKQNLSIRVASPLLFAVSTLPPATQGTTYNQTITVTGGTGTIVQTIVNGNPPPGVTFNGVTGTLSGIPTASGPFSFTVQAMDSASPPQVALQGYTINVSTTQQVPANVTFVTQPGNSVGGQVLAGSPIIVQVTDNSGAAIAGANVSMTFQNGTPPCAAATLSGTLTQTTNAQGQASFPDLSIDRGQLGYALLAIAVNATAVSNPFTVNGFCATATLSTPRELHTETLLANSKVLIAGGINSLTSSGVPLNSAELYDPATGTVAPTGNLTSPNGRDTHASVLLPSGKVLLVGGDDATNSSTGNPLATAELYDPASGTFSPTGNMAHARALANAVLLANGKVLVAGGVGLNGDLNSAEIYDPATGLFTLTGNLNQARARHTMTVLPNGTVLIAGGRTFSGAPVTVFASAEIFDPAANNGVGAFTAIGSMNTPRDEERATLLANGKVLLTGGFVSYQTGLSTSSAEIFDPATNTFTTTGNMSVARAHPTASLLADGTVLVAGGVPDTGATTPASPTADIFNPSNGTFSTTGSMTMQREYAQATVLPNGNPLISGGDDGVNTAATEEIYYSTAPQAPIAITTTTLAAASTGQPFTQILLEQGGLGNLTWSETGALPAGMTFSNRGVLSGTPTVAGTFQLTITVTDSSTPAKTVSGNFTLTVANTPLAFTSSTVPTATAGTPYSQTLPVAGGTQPYSSTVTSGTLPPGLTLVGNSLLGTPSGSGNFTFTVTVTDASTPTQTATQTLTMAVNTLVITTTVLPNGIVAVPYSAAINTAGGTLPLSFSLANTAFPPGLLIQQASPGSSSGALAGTPTLAGTYRFSESVIDSSNPQQTATQNYVVTIAPAGSAVPANVTFVSQPQNSVGGQTLSGGPIVVQVTDANNSPIPGTTVAMTFGGIFGTPLPCSVARLNGNLTAMTDATGRATFSNLSIDRGGLNFALLASTGSASGSSGPFSVQGFCASGNLSTPREGHTQDVLGTKNMRKFPLDPAGAYLFASTNPGPAGIPDNPHPPLIISLAQFGVKPGDVISGFPVGDANACGVGQFCFGEIFSPFTCAVFSSSNTLLPPGGAINRVPGAIAPDFSTVFPCNTGNTAFGNLPTDIPQDFALVGERVTVPPGAAYLFVGVADIFFADNSDPNGDFGVAFTLNSTTSVNGKVLIAGGADNNGNALNTAELYDPAFGNTQPTGNLTDPNGRANHVSVVLPNGKVLLVGGFSNVSNLATAELYDPATGTFTPTGSMSQPRGLPAAVLLADGRVLVSGGFNTQVASNTAEIYDPATGLFTPTGNMTQGRGRHQMTLLPNGKVLVTGGRDAQQNFFALASAEIFDPFANQGLGAFTAIGNMNSPRFKHTANLLSNSTVLIAGGFNGDSTSASVATAEIFDPSTNTFTPTGSMNTPRARHTSTLLPDGTLLEAGGINGFNGVIAAAPAELYSPSSGTFSLTGPMITGRELPTATLLPAIGNVLLSGGDDGVNVLASTEIYYNPVAQGPVVITTASVPNAFISQPYVQLLLEQNRSGPIIWSLASGALPPGITLGTNGILSGTPTTVGSFNFTVQVTDGISTATASFTINVSLATLAFTSNTMPPAGAGKPYSQPLPITGGTLPYNATLTGGALPPGLVLKSSGGVSGTTSSTGLFTFTVSVSDSSAPIQTATQTLTIAVDSLFITSTALPSGMVGVPYNAAISTAGGTLPLTFSSATAAFPPGLTIQQPTANSPSGALTGTPTQPGHYTFSESVVDSSSPAQTAAQSYTIDISPAGTTAVPATVTFLTPPQNSVGGQILAGSPIRVHVADASNAPIPGVLVAMSFNGPPPCSSAVLSGTLSAITNGAGNAVFFALSIDRGQLGYTLLATTGSASAVSPSFTVNGFCPTASLSIPRLAGTQVLLGNGRVLFAGGVSSSTSALRSAEVYDPSTSSVTPTGTLTAANGRSNQVSVVLPNGKVLLAGGSDSSNNALASAELYDPNSGTFSPTGSMNQARGSSATGVLLANGKVLVSGGVFVNVLNSAEIYDPTTGLFTPTGNMNQARLQHTMSLLPDGRVLVEGGQDTSGNVVGSAEIFDPNANQAVGAFISIGNTISPRDGATSTLLDDGTVILTGGATIESLAAASSSSETFDPSAGAFTSAGSMTNGRLNHTATLLPDGTVLTAGGLNSTGALTSADVYHPSVRAFTPTGSLVTARGGAGATLLNNGTALVSGGTDISLSPTASQEIYYSTAPLAPLQVTTPSAATLGGPGTVVYTTQAAFTAAASIGTVGFNGILPSGSSFVGFNSLVVGGITFSTPQSASGVNVNVTISTFYTPNTYPADFITNSVVPATGVAGPTNTVTMTLSQPTNAFGMDFGGLGFSGPSSATITLSNGFVLPLSSLPTVGTTQFRGFVSSTPFTSITFTATNDDYVVKDVMLGSVNTVLPPATLGRPYTQILLEQGGVGALTWTQTGGSLPSGIALTSDGILHGTPTATGTFIFTAGLTDSSAPAKVTSATFSLTVNGGTPLTFPAQTLPTATTGSAYSASLSASGGTPPISLVVTGGSLPAGITVSTNGVFSGTTNTMGTFTFTVTATDSSSPPQSISQSFTLQVANPFVITTTSLPNGTVGTAYSAGISSSGGLQPAGFAVTSGIFPPGLTLASNGAITGIPTAANTFTFTITATDASTPSLTASQTYTVTIAPAVVVPAHVNFVDQPQNAIAGQIIIGQSPLQVQVLDVNNVAMPNVPVTIGFNGTPPCAAATLGGTLTQSTDASGIASFGDLVVDRGQFNYSLAATAGNLTAISNPFNVEGFCDTGSLATGRLLHSSLSLLNGKVLTAGGASSFNTNAIFSSAELYDPATHSFTTVGSMHSPRSSFTMTLLQNGLVLVTGGFSGSALLSSAELFDPSTNTFTLLPSSMAVVRSEHRATLLANGKVLVTGGNSSAGILANAEIFDPATNTFRMTNQPMNSPRFLHRADLLPNGKVLISGGSGNVGNNVLSSAELYDPIADTFTSTGSMATPRYDHASALLFTGKVLVAGGNTGTTVTTTAELYDVSTGTFSSTGNTTVGPGAIYGSDPIPVLADGSVFLTDSGNVARIYDPTAGSFRATGITTTLQVVPSAVVLPDDTVLLAGGSDASSNGISNGEIFYPINVVPISITTVLPTALLNVPYTQQLLEKGGVGALTWTVSTGTLPAGLALSPGGLLTGTPTIAGVSQFTVQVTDSSTPPQTTSTNFIVAVVPPIVISATLPTANPGVAYSQSLLAFGAAPPLTFALTAGTLPSGLNLAADGTVTGTTTAIGTFSFTVTATDSSTPPVNASQVISMTVAAPLAITTGSLPNGQVGIAYNASLASSGGAGTVVFVVTSGTPPPGLTLSPLGVLSGTPTGTGTFPFTISAGDSSAQPQVTSQNFTITITPAPNSIALTPNPLNLTATNTGTMTLTLGSVAPANGMLVTLSSDNNSVATVPQSVTVSQGQTTTTLQVTAGTSAGSATITASSTGFTNGTATVNVTTRPMSLTTDGPLLAVNRSFSATVTLAQPVPNGTSVTVGLSASPSGIVSISPATQTMQAGQTTVVFTLTAGSSGGSVALSATASGYTTATAPLTVTTAVISLQTGVVVAPGQSVSMALSLSQPAPPGGLTVNLASSANGTATVTPTLFIPAGAQTPDANPQVTGVLIGSVTITASATGFAPDSKPINVTVTATLSPNPATVIANGGTTAVTLTISAPAPAGGINFTLLTDSPATATVPAQATVIQGATTVQFQVTGVAAASTTLRADSTGISEATATVNVNPAPPITMSSVSVGQNLQSAINLFLGAAAPVGGVTVTVTSSDPTAVLLSKTGKDAGSSSVQFTIGAGNSFVGTLYIYGLQGTGTVQLTATAAGYATGTGTVTLEPSGFIINSPGSISTTTFSPATLVQVTPALLIPGTPAGTLNWGGNQALRPGIGPLSISLSLTGGTPGTITPTTLIFNGGDSFQNASFQPSSAGTATLALGAQPASFSTPSQFTQISVSVTAPSISLSNLTIGNNLQSVTGVFLGAIPPNPMTVTVSTDPTKLLLSTTGKDAGSSTVTFTNVTSTFVGTLFVYALQGTGTAQISASATGFATGTGTVTLEPSGFIINSPGSISTTTFSSATLVQVTPALLIPGTPAGTLNWGGNQALRPGIGPLSISLSLTGGTPGTITPTTLTFNGGDSFQNASFQPSSAGTATLALGAQPASFSTPSQFTQIPVNVTAPSISVPSSMAVGLNLQVSMSIFLQTAPPNPVTLTVTSPNSSIVALTADPSVVGAGTVTFTNVTSSFVGTITIQGMSRNTTQLKLQAPGYADAFVNLTVNPSGFIINTPNNFTASVGSNTLIQITPGMLDPATLNWAGNQTLRAGASASVGVTSSDTTIGTINTSPLAFTGNSTLANTAFQAVQAGTAFISVATPLGFSTPGDFTTIQATVQ